MPHTWWQQRVLVMVKKYPGLTARQIHARLELGERYYREVGNELRELEKAGLVESREEGMDDWLRERTWWPL